MQACQRGVIAVFHRRLEQQLPAEWRGEPAIIADLAFELEESRMLDIIRQRFGLDRDDVAVIEQAAAIRHRTLK